MSGTSTGGVKAAQTNKTRYGSDFYRIIGAKGGSISRGGGFAQDNRTILQKLMGVPKLASVAGAKGGHISKRGPAR